MNQTKTFKMIALMLFFVLCVGTRLQAQFITTWITTDGQITIPTFPTSTYNYTVTWTNLTNAGVGNGTISGRTGDHLITGLQNGSTYSISITGLFPRIFIGDFFNALKLRTIAQWGTNTWTSMAFAFNTCSNLTYTATDNPDLSGVTDMSNMFRLCSIFNGTINGWNTTNITNMDFMFFNASAFNQNIGGWNTTNVTSMRQMFQQATTFNQNISSWNTANVTNMRGMFSLASNFNQNISNWNTANVTNMSEMFALASNFNQNVSSWNTANITNMSAMFQQATVFNQSLASWNIGNVTNMALMLDNSGLSVANYDATLIGWAAQTRSGITLGALNLKYCASAAARATLTSAPRNWIITGDALIAVTISPTSASLPAGVVGASYSQTISQAGFRPTDVLSWSISAGTLPAGLSIASTTGIISGTPTTLGTSSFTVQVSSGCSQTRTYTIIITCPTITFTN